ncbi:MAG: hypothetical protein FJ312_11350 [SAR202 cluster bacterium]|nr:hypothetical protein [Armatimonadota bacterium]MBM3739969.1 hypothetical protein [Acidobacteriota bacterium]MBM3949807.1 hypothetical protein [SAR202 cluster bacterium]
MTWLTLNNVWEIRLLGVKEGTSAETVVYLVNTDNAEKAIQAAGPILAARPFIKMPDGTAAAPDRIEYISVGRRPDLRGVGDKVLNLDVRVLIEVEVEGQLLSFGEPVSSAHVTVYGIETTDFLTLAGEARSFASAHAFVFPNEGGPSVPPDRVIIWRMAHVQAIPVGAPLVRS